MLLILCSAEFYAAAKALNQHLRPFHIFWFVRVELRDVYRASTVRVSDVISRKPPEKKHQLYPAAMSHFRVPVMIHT
jgi:hypothetical protein